jgi:hypothetical protein
MCNLLSWGGSPEYLVIDTSEDWDIRHFLADRKDFKEGVSTMEKNNFIQMYQQKGNAALYKILKKPDDNL